MEIAAFDEFFRLLGDKDATKEFDHVVFDTAPTGHTLRLLTLPSAWSGFMDTNTTETSCLGPLAGLQAQRRIYQKTVETLGNPETTTLIWVTHLRSSALNEAARTSSKLRKLGVANQHLIINGVFLTKTLSDLIAVKMQSRCQTTIESIPTEIDSLERTTVPLLAAGLMGIDALRLVGQEVESLGIEPVEVTRIGESIPDGLGSRWSGIVDR